MSLQSLCHSRKWSGVTRQLRGCVYLLAVSLPQPMDWLFPLAEVFLRCQQSVGVASADTRRHSVLIVGESSQHSDGGRVESCKLGASAVRMLLGERLSCG